MKKGPNLQAEEDSKRNKGDKDQFSRDDPQLQGTGEALSNIGDGNDRHQHQTGKIATHVAREGEADIAFEKHREGCCSKAGGTVATMTKPVKKALSRIST